MYKLILCPLALIIGSYIGFSISGRFEKRVKQLELSLIMLQKIKVYLEFEKTPTRTIIKNLAKSQSLEGLVFLKKCDEMLEDNINFPVVWMESLELSKTELAFEEDDYMALAQLSEVIGAYDAIAQTGGISILEKQIKAQLEDATEKNKTTGKLYRSLGVMGGLATAILML